MSQHTINLQWDFAPHPDNAEDYNRNHKVTLNGGQTVGVSSAVDFLGDGVDP